MTLVSYSLAAICFGAAAYRQKSAAATKGVGLVEVLGGATRAKDLLTVVTVYVGTTTLTKTSLRYIDVPTQTILKSAKLLPVMAGSILILRRSFHRREWIAALMLVSGMVAFSSSSARPSLQRAPPARDASSSRWSATRFLARTNSACSRAASKWPS